MPYSTCCGAHTTMTELDICPECFEHCDWEDDDSKPEEDIALSQLKYNLNRDKMAENESSKNKSDDYDRPE